MIGSEGPHNTIALRANDHAKCCIIVSTVIICVALMTRSFSSLYVGVLKSSVNWGSPGVPTCIIGVLM